jgi:solute carrier family 13 (sodium-dependent dicarboxylate transporter), member 2/3/5
MVESKNNRLAFWGGLITSLISLLFFSIIQGLSLPIAGTIAVTILCATWWMTEAIPIAATSMLPFALLPVCGALSHKDVAGAYGHYMILLLLGGFFLSIALEKNGAHRRIALGLVRVIGGKPKTLIFGFMLASAICSMWISNTATTLALLPVALAVLSEDSMKDCSGKLLLAIAYGASIGGIGTPIGTPPNMLLISEYERVQGTEINFFRWMSLSIPIIIIFLPITWLWLTRGITSKVKVQIPSLGEWTIAERKALGVFLVTAVLWTSRPFWPKELGLEMVGDSTIAMAAACLLFCIPAGSRKGTLLEWDDAKQIPWGLLLLFGGGIAIAKAFQSTGLSTSIGNFLIEDMQIFTWPKWVMIGVLSSCVTFLTEITSNTATTSLLMPILSSTSSEQDPMLLMLPAALSASCAFMLPVATAPNAIVFGTGKVSMSEMIKEGFVLNCIGVVVITLCLSIYL